MSRCITWTGRRSPRNIAFHGPRERPRTLHTQLRGIRPAVEPSRTPEMAPLVPYHHRGECIQGTIGPDISDNFFMIRLDSDTTLRIDFATTDSVGGLQVVRLPDGQSNGSVNPADVISTSSTLVTNPVTLDLDLAAGLYLIRVCNFFNDADESPLGPTMPEAANDHAKSYAHRRSLLPVSLALRAERIGLVRSRDFDGGSPFQAAAGVDFSDPARRTGTPPSAEWRGNGR